MTRVSIQKCTEYSNKTLRETIKQGLRDIGFDAGLFEGKRVGLKPNMLMPSKTEKAIVTHPQFVKAVAQVVRDHGGTPVLAECPGFLSLANVVKRTGYNDMVKEIGLEVACTDESAIINYEQAETFKRIEISKAFFNFDIIISLPKFKTHGFTYISGAVKNLFGTIPGLKKSKMHMRCPKKEEFAEWLLDLNGALLTGFGTPKTFLHIIDGIIGQEGEGPGPSGTPRQIGVIITGQDPIAVDWVMAGVADLDIKYIRTITSGFGRPFGVNSPDEIEVVGERIEDVRLDDFVPTKSSFRSHMLRGILVGRWAKNLLVEKPVPSADKCTLCYQCKTICPAGAIDKASGKKKTPQYDYNKCIRCFCCMEICPEAAISLRRGRLQWMMGF